MPSLADAMKDIDAKIFGAIGEVMLVSSVSVPGMFYKRHREVEIPDGTIVGLAISFDCQYSDTVGSLDEGDSVVIKVGTTEETYSFIRRFPDTGDESGLTHIELGSP